LDLKAFGSEFRRFLHFTSHRIAMVIGAVVALWAATLAAADESCLLQTFPPTQELQVEAW
jgi:5-enolpyruvylshikimate-3-phosphate synthase